LQSEVRTFISEELKAGSFIASCDSWLSNWDEVFSRKLGTRGWIGMTIPKSKGGHGRSSLERYIVNEELLAAGAPVAAHWMADRQIVPSLLRYGTEDQQQMYLPAIAKGDCYFAIGLSEPDVGSDLAAVRTKAKKVLGGWLLSGTKIWTSGAHRAHALSILARTSPWTTENRHFGLSQFIVDPKSEGVNIRPILSLTGEHHFNEVVFVDTFVSDKMVLGGVGDGWRQITSELAYERSGPERWLSTFPLLVALIAQVRSSKIESDAQKEQVVGELATRIWALRQMSLAVAGSLARDEVPEVAAALVKDMGTRFEGDLINLVRSVAATEPNFSGDALARELAQAICHSPGFTLRGGTNEILRGVVARSLGMR
jgi:alkylation response protein AidB-like acyl-CoA dehydrogenase